MKRKNIETCDVTYVHSREVASARRAIPAESTLEALTETFKVLGDMTRLKIMTALSREELCVCDIASLLGVSESAISHQLRFLKTMRLVKYRKAGKMVYYTLDDDHIQDLIRVGVHHVKEASGGSRG
ncbi:MAG: metalloregulator ArsR/SmtB family transcription factor [Ignavibacteria bacterium]|nr:metalloregulator ArsR/SmtB family transcription factor [Ignavibacteria bacterium]